MIKADKDGNLKSIKVAVNSPEFNSRDNYVDTAKIVTRLLKEYEVLDKDTYDAKYAEGDLSIFKTDEYVKRFDYNKTEEDGMYKMKINTLDVTDTMDVTYITITLK